MTLAVGRLGRGERGDTLVEVLVAIVIVGVAFVAILGGMATSIVGSDIHRKQSTEETALASLAEAMKDDQAVPYANCATTASYPVPASVTSQVDSSYTPTVVSVLYWNGDTPATFSAACPSLDRGLQQVTVRVDRSASDKRATETVTVLKRRGVPA